MSAAPSRFRTAGTVISGVGCFGSVAETIAEHLGFARRALIATSPSLERQGFVAELRSRLDEQGIASEVVGDIRPEPTASQIERLRLGLNGEKFDVYVGLGGGSVLDATKLLAVYDGSRPLAEWVGVDKIDRPGPPTVLIPTTAGSGSEATPNAIVTLPELELKAGIVSRHLYPAMAFADPELTFGLPQAVTAATGMDAFTHALEAYLSNKANAFSDMAALEGIRKLSAGMVESYEDGSSLPARESMLYGSVFAGMAIASAGSAAVHALAYPLGGKFDVAHGVANAMLLPHVMAFQADSVSDRLANVAEAMGLRDVRSGTAGERVAERLESWTNELSIPHNLRDFGVTESDVPGLAAMASKVTRLMSNNRKTLSLADTETIYRKLLR